MGQTRVGTRGAATPPVRSDRRTVPTVAVAARIGTGYSGEFSEHLPSLGLGP
ncbi:hypothetical protein [Haloarcula sp. JP-L23]|uniref:hypothetical protein n=1 Tax=Haloarcula sp. JP-L23 TaxID=2716717 RepID=UPI00140F0676|nr:hypothetical protein G9465_07420 [Haloarcula sp. JP-L23]